VLISFDVQISEEGDLYLVSSDEHLEKTVSIRPSKDLVATRLLSEAYGRAQRFEETANA
jgi:hypothetical protein